MSSSSTVSSNNDGDNDNDNSTNEREPLHHHSNSIRTHHNMASPRRQQNAVVAKLKAWLIEVVTGGSGDGNKDDDESRQRRRKRRLLMFSVLAMTLVAYVRSSKRQQQRRIASSSSSSSSSAALSKSGALWPMGLLMAWWKGPEYRQNPQQSTMNLLYKAAKEGAIQQALIGSHAIFFQTTQQHPQLPSNKRQTQNKGTTRWNLAMLPPNNESIKSGLLEALATGGCQDVQAIPESISSQLATPLLAALPFVYLAFLYRMMKNQFGGEDISSKLTNGTRNLLGSEEEDDRTTFADVAGLPSAVRDMAEVVSYLSNPSRYKSMGARPPQGVLLHGPPGSGKTLLARAVAGEAMCDSFTALSGSAFVEMYVGRGAARVRALFQQARSDALRRRALRQTASWWSSFLGLPSAWMANNSTSSLLQQRPACAILFIDELDAVAKSRSSDGMHGNDEREQTLNQLLTEMDGFDTGASNERDNDKNDVTLIVIAASNRADVIDPAVLRRFDRQIFVGYPDAGGRRDILQIHGRKIACASNVDWNQLSSDAYTGDFSGADLRNLVNEAALFAVQEKSSMTEQTHLLHAARRISQMKTRTSSTSSRTALPMFFANID